MNSTGLAHFSKVWRWEATGHVLSFDHECHFWRRYIKNVSLWSDMHRACGWCSPSWAVCNWWITARIFGKTDFVNVTKISSVLVWRAWLVQAAWIWLKRCVGFFPQNFCDSNQVCSCRDHSIKSNSFLFFFSDRDKKCVFFVWSCCQFLSFSEKKEGVWFDFFGIVLIGRGARSTDHRYGSKTVHWWTSYYQAGRAGLEVLRTVGDWKRKVQRGKLERVQERERERESLGGAGGGGGN